MKKETREILNKLPLEQLALIRPLVEALEKCHVEIGDDVYIAATRADVISRDAVKSFEINLPTHLSLLRRKRRK